MKALSLEKKDFSIIELLNEIESHPIKSDDPFFSAAPVDIGNTNNDIIDRALYGFECQK